MKIEGKETFAEKHPRVNILIGLLFAIGILVVGLLIIVYIFRTIGEGLKRSIDFLEGLVNSTDAVIIVALITGGVSVVGVIISSIVGKVVDYRYNVKKYLYDKREEPYSNFINMIYQIADDTKKLQEDRMTEEEMIKLIADFSKGLTLWGSNRVVKKWIKYRKESINDGGESTLILMENIIFDMRKDMGLRKGLKKGDVLSFFINDIEKIIK